MVADFCGTVFCHRCRVYIQLRQVSTDISKTFLAVRSVPEEKYGFNASCSPHVPLTAKAGFFEARPPISHLDHSAPVNSSWSHYDPAEKRSSIISEKTATFSSLGLASPSSESEALAQSRRVPLHRSHPSLHSLDTEDSRSYARHSVFPSDDTVSDISPTLNRTPTADSSRASALDGAESSTRGIAPASRSSRDSISDFAHSHSRDSTHGGHSSRHSISDVVHSPTRSATT